jgi:hypothetical protein
MAAVMYWQSWHTSIPIVEPDLKGLVRVKPRTLQTHYIMVNAVLVDFHKAQCYFSIALQIASLVTLLSPKDSATFSDKSFLLIVCAEGLIPIVLSLYTIMTFAKASWYMIILSIITMIPASAAGGYLFRNVLDPNTVTDNVSDGQFPPVCGSVGPSSFCNGLSVSPPGDYQFINAPQAFLVVMAFMDTLAVTLVVWKAIPIIIRKLRKQKKSQAPVADEGTKEHNPSRREDIVKISLHTIAVLVLLGCLGAEFFFFRAMFASGYLHWEDWGFGQIVGFTTWFGLLADFAYIETGKPF